MYYESTIGPRCKQVESGNIPLVDKCEFIEIGLKTIIDVCLVKFAINFRKHLYQFYNVYHDLTCASVAF